MYATYVPARRWTIEQQWEYVGARTRLVWGEAAARTWLKSPNAFLSGARPIDVLRVDGPARILEALDAEAWGEAA